VGGLLFLLYASYYVSHAIGEYDIVVARALGGDVFGGLVNAAFPAVEIFLLVRYGSIVRRAGQVDSSYPETSELGTAVGRLAAVAYLPTPKVVVLDDSIPIAFTVGLSRRRSTIVLSRGLIDELEPRELDAVIAHELAHIVHRDTAVMTVLLYPVIAFGWWVRRMRGWLFPLFIVPPMWASAVGLTAMLLTSRCLAGSLSRTRELDADRTAALITGSAEPLMSALTKLEARLAGIPDVDLRDVAPLQALLVLPVRTRVETHPPLAVRLESLDMLSHEIWRLPALRAHQPLRAAEWLAVGAAIALPVWLWVFGGTLPFP
jgi:heat shock protein HtpX